LKALYLIITFLGFSIFTSGQEKKFISAIAFYNFENLFDTENDPKNFGDDEFTPNGAFHYTEDIYKQKLHNLATVLKQLATEITPDGPAIIGTAEIENGKVLSDLVAQPEIRDRNYQFIHFNSYDYRGIDVAMLYNPRYFHVITAKALPVNISSSTQKKGTTRDVLFVHGIFAGDTINLFINHWPSRRGGQAASAPLRAIAAAVSRRVIDSLTAINPRTKAIVMGDLNDDPTDESVRVVLRAKGNIKTLSDKDLYNPFESFYKKGIGSLGYEDHWDLFDQVILTPSFLNDDHGWRFYKSEVFNREFLKTKSGRYKGYPHRSFDQNNNWLNGYSDHFPTLVYLVKG
jgi:hypothetical protein